MEVGVGAIIGDSYRLTAQIGRGGMGAVWCGEHVRLPGRRVAIKLLLGVADGEALARFRHEAEVTSRIGHPNIVQVIDFNNLPSGDPYLVMELLSGESLAARLRRGPLTFDQTAGI